MCFLHRRMLVCTRKPEARFWKRSGPHAFTRAPAEASATIQPNPRSPALPLLQLIVGSLQYPRMLQHKLYHQWQLILCKGWIHVSKLHLPISTHRGIEDDLGEVSNIL